MGSEVCREDGLAGNRPAFRWWILGFLFAATMILYIDRSILGLLAPELQNKIGWSEEQYGYINSAFMVAYAICFLLMGKIIDRIGTRVGYAISISVWALASAAHVLAGSWLGFAAARFGLAVGQSGNFPAANKAVAEWFPPREKALAVSIFNGGSNVGIMLAPLVVPMLVLSSGRWQAGFLWTFPLSLIWIALWLKFYAPPSGPQDRGLSAEPVSAAGSDALAVRPRVPLRRIISHREAWAIAVAKFITDPIWWFYLFWGAKYLYSKYDIDLKKIGPPFFLIYLISWGLGMALGGVSSSLLKAGYSLNRGRKLGLLACAALTVPVVLVPHVEKVWPAVALIALAAGGHCGWSANVFSLMSDIFPKAATASVTGFGGFCGALGGIIATFSVGKILQNAGTAGYAIPFAVAGGGYLLALLLIHLLVPKIRPIEL